MAMFGKKAAKEPIDLRDSVDLRTSPRFEFGFPTRCATCNDRGYLDHIDPFKRIQYEHCKGCGAKWELAEAEIAALNA